MNCCFCNCKWDSYILYSVDLNVFHYLDERDKIIELNSDSFTIDSKTQIVYGKFCSHYCIAKFEKCIPYCLGCDMIDRFCICYS